MSIALFLIGCLAFLAGIVMLLIALVRKRGWGVVRALVLGGVGIVLVIVGIVVGISEEAGKPETITPATPVTPTAPKTTEVAEAGKSRTNPIPVGSALTYGDQRVTVLSSERVNQIGWHTASTGKIYLIVKLKVDFLGDPSRTHHLYASDFDVVGNTGHVYEYEWIDTDTPLKKGEFYGGATTSGDLVYEIDQIETNMVLIWHCGLVTDRYLQVP